MATVCRKFKFFRAVPYKRKCENDLFSLRHGEGVKPVNVGVGSFLKILREDIRTNQLFPGGCIHDVTTECNRFLSGEFCKPTKE